MPLAAGATAEAGAAAPLCLRAMTRSRQIGATVAISSRRCRRIGAASAAGTGRRSSRGRWRGCSASAARGEHRGAGTRGRNLQEPPSIQEPCMAVGCIMCTHVHSSMNRSSRHARSTLIYDRLAGLPVPPSPAQLRLVARHTSLQQPPSSFPQTYVERIPQSITNQAEPEHGQRNGKTGKEHHPRRALQDRTAIVDHCPPGWCRAVVGRGRGN